uniref:Putative 5.3 kDa antibacterial peptide n=1 Tax=Hyalomma excavatum TaxID=257692 RepID=A0A131XLE1_9ACAR
MQYLSCIVIILLCACDLFPSAQASCSSNKPERRGKDPTCVGEDCGLAKCPSPCKTCKSNNPWCNGYCYL